MSELNEFTLEPIGNPHDFLSERGYVLIASSKRKYRKGSVFIGFDKAFNRCIIMRRLNRIDSDNKLYHVVYKGLNPFDDQEFAANLFRHLNLHRMPTAPVQEGDEVEDSDALLNW